MILHEISYELVNDIYGAFAKNEHWMAYTTKPFLLERGNLHSFAEEKTAKAFVEAKRMQGEAWTLIRAENMGDVYKQILYEKDLFINVNTTVMNEKNVDYLKDNLKYLGFGDRLSSGLEAEVAKGAPQFQLHLETEMNKKSFAAVLNFRKSDTGEMYFFNSYQASLWRSNGEVMDQTFYVNKGKGVTLKEAFNLLEGRAVHKELANREGQTYRAWLQLDLAEKDKSGNHEVKQFHENYGFHLEDALGKYPIREMQEADLKEVLLRSLEKGNLQAVTFVGEGTVAKLFVEANPQYKSVNVYDSSLRRLQKEDLQLYTGREQAQEKGMGQKQETTRERKKKSAQQVESPRQTRPGKPKKSIGH
ncbi:hypothetical protein [Flavisolibacter nicotianae]|uniref:hypothetical protein n=1 Tax=Flavisolibacter nicotianae TaxID=2364882 RepID=UPI000EACF626|nr:hypothetical protein [Flavisolibacter nicotianae]